MGIHITALGNALACEPDAKAAVHPPGRVGTPQGRAWSELSTRLFAVEPRSVIAFGSVHRGAGVTHIVRGVAGDLRSSGKCVAVLDGNLRSADGHGHILGTSLSGAARDEENSIAGLRRQYDTILLDCGALETSTHLLRLASDADGVVLA